VRHAAAPNDEWLRDRGRPDEATPDVICERLIWASLLSPISLRKIATAGNLVDDVASAAVALLVEDGRAIVLQRPVEYVSRSAFENAWGRAADTLRARHANAPWRVGCSTAELAAAMGTSDALATRLLAAWSDDGRISQRAQFWYLPDFALALTPAQHAFLDAATAVGTSAPLVPASYDAIARNADAAKINGLRDALDALVAVGTFIRIGDDLYRRSQIERAQAALVRVLAEQPQGATMARLRDEFGTSRKYALPLLEYFDTVGVTIRDGDLRRLRAAPPVRRDALR
jgi:selenocysteine-specific elongation factor